MTPAAARRTEAARHRYTAWAATFDRAQQGAPLDRLRAALSTIQPASLTGRRLDAALAAAGLRATFAEVRKGPTTVTVWEGGTRVLQGQGADRFAAVAALAGEAGARGWKWRKGESHDDG